MTIAKGVGRGSVRIGTFGWGVMVGVVFPVVVAVGLFGLFKFGMPKSAAPKFNVDVVSLGAEVTRHGGRQLVVRHERGWTVQTCRDGCDDLHLQQFSGDNAYGVAVLDGAGKTLASDSDGYVTGGYGTSISRFDVSGRDVLRVRARVFRADGTEVVMAPDPKADAEFKAAIDALK